MCLIELCATLGSRGDLTVVIGSDFRANAVDPLKGLGGSTGRQQQWLLEIPLAYVHPAKPRLAECDRCDTDTRVCNKSAIVNSTFCGGSASEAFAPPCPPSDGFRYARVATLLTTEVISHPLRTPAAVCGSGSLSTL